MAEPPPSRPWSRVLAADAGGSHPGGAQPLPAARPLTVGILAPPWLPVPPAAYGGTENVLDALARGLVAAGHRVVLFTTGDSTCPVERRWCHPRAVGIGAGGVVDEARQVVEGYRALRGAGVDVVHDHTVVGPLYGAGLPGLAVVATNHGPFGPELAPIYAAVADRVGVIAISHHQAGTAAGMPLAGVVHHGIDVDGIPVGAGRGGYALFVGRMHPDKGIDRAIAAARDAGMPLRIAAKMGEPAERRYFDEVIAPLLGGNVEYVGEVDRPAKVALLGDACCLLDPVQWDEPFGMVVPEALACGTPVVASDRGSLPELVDHGRTGFVCTDHASLVAALHAVGQLDRSQCRAVAERRFSAARMVADHLTVYRAAVAAAGRLAGRAEARSGAGAGDPETQGVAAGRARRLADAGGEGRTRASLHGPPSVRGPVAAGGQA